MLDSQALLGTLVDNRYRLTRFLSSGAFGWVYVADEIVFGEVVGEVAVKLIRTRNDSPSWARLGRWCAVLIPRC